MLSIEYDNHWEFLVDTDVLLHACDLMLDVYFTESSYRFIICCNYVY